MDNVPLITLFGGCAQRSCACQKVRYESLK